jgi:hypothetical protein
MQTMKSAAIGFLVLSCIRCLAAEDTNIVGVSEWSEPVDFRDHSVRGRLLILGGSEPAYGGPRTGNLTMTFVELEHTTGASGCSVKLYFDVMGLKCELTDSNGKPAHKPQGGAWGGRGPFSPRWVVLPYNSAIRLFVNSGSKSPLNICRGGEPWDCWSIIE